MKNTGRPIDVYIAAKGITQAEMIAAIKQYRRETDALPKDVDSTRRLGPYAVERLREQLRVLEPQEKFDPYRHTRKERTHMSFVRESVLVNRL